MPTRATHPFAARPHRAFLALTLPVLASLVAEPLVGLVDTAFVARLGAEPLAALGIAATVLSSIFWVTNFLGIGSQTQAARAFGRNDTPEIRDVAVTALLASAGVGVLLCLAIWPAVQAIARFMSEDPGVREGVAVYLRIRLLAGPAVLITFAVSGVLRAMQDMRTPMWVALAVNAVNLALDPLLIFGAGPVPALGLAGAAVASTLAQWLGGGWIVWALHRRIGLARPRGPGHARDLFRAGRDLTLRTGLLLLFLLLATRAANRLGAEAGAAHQAVRQVWLLTALILDAYATAGQSLAGAFLGSGDRFLARRVARVAGAWGLATGFALAAVMLWGQASVERLLVPAAATAAFAAAWPVCAWLQPLNAVAFVSDGLHWGSGDYAYLRNGMIVATGLGLAGLVWLESLPDSDLSHVWLVTAAWAGVRAGLGALRIWPGFGRAPYRV